MGDVKVDAEVFKTRVSAIVAAWKVLRHCAWLPANPSLITLIAQGAKDDPDLSPLGTLGSILLVAGNSDEANPYRKTGALQTFLLGYEFPSTLTLLTPKSITFVCSEGKAKLLQPLAGKAGKNVDVVVKVKTKDAAQSKEIFEEVATSIEEAGGQVGTLPKDKYAGKFVVRRISAWPSATSAARSASLSFDGTGRMDEVLGGLWARIFALRCARRRSRPFRYPRHQG